MNDPQSRIQQRKRVIRRAGRDARAALDPETRRSASRQIADHVVHASFFRRSRSIACYIAMTEEVDTRWIIERAWRMRKKIFAPICAKRRLLRFRELRPDTRLVRSDFGLLEPAEGNFILPRRLDLVLAPLVAFDADHARVGMGGGYYDTTFAFLRERREFLKPKLVGLAFACQEVDRIQKNPWDIGLYTVITENGRQDAAPDPGCDGQHR